MENSTAVKLLICLLIIALVCYSPSRISTAPGYKTLAECADEQNLDDVTDVFVIAAAVIVIIVILSLPEPKFGMETAASDSGVIFQTEAKT